VKDLTVAAVSMQSLFGDMEANLKKVDGYAAAAAARNADMVCFPELTLTGYSIRDDVGPYAETIPGPSSRRIVEIARKHGIVVLVGMLEKGKGERPYISHVIADPSGIVGVYRKTHLSPMERDIYEQGHDVAVFTCGDTTFGIQLCYESHFPELSTLMSLQGIDILFLPFASPNRDPDKKRASWLRMLPARAYDNGVFLVACNQTGENGRGLSFPGVMIMLDPSGKEISHYAGHDEHMIVEELLQGDLDRARDNRMQAFMNYRRPELYVKLSSVADKGT